MKRFLISSIIFSILILTANACSSMPIAPGETPSPIPTETSTPIPTATETPAPTESLLPAEFKDLQDRLGAEFKLYDSGEKDPEGKAIMGMKNKDGKPIESVKVYADGTTSFVYNETDLTIASIVVDAEHLGPWHIENGKIIIDTSPAPKTVEDAKLLPRQALILDHPKYNEMNETNRLYDQWSMAKSDTYDPLNEFKGIIVDGKEVEITDIVPEFIVGSIPGNDAPISIGGEGSDSIIKGIYYPAEGIALYQGWSALEVYDITGNKIYDLINVPIVNLMPDSSIVVTNGLLNKDKLLVMLPFLNIEKRPDIYAEIISGEVTNSITIKGLFSDVKLRQFMVTYNKNFLDLNIIQEDMMQLPSELSTMVYFDFEQ